MVVLPVVVVVVVVMMLDLSKGECLFFSTRNMS